MNMDYTVSCFLLCFIFCWTDGSPADCNFEQGNLCGYQQLSSTGTPHDDLDWILNQGPTHTSNTGPDNDHTYGNHNGHYLYINSASGRSGNKAVLISPVVQCHTTHATLTFWYSMYGASMGHLIVLIATPHLQHLHTVWSKSGNQGSGWKMASVTLDLSQPTEIIFNGVTGWGTHSEMAIDDISLVSITYIQSAPVTFNTQPSTTETFSTQPPTTETFNTQPPTTETLNTCQQCEGLQCFTAPVTLNCSSLQPLCFSRVKDSANGERSISKGCMSASECNAWIPGDAEVQLCLSVDQQVTGHDLDCLFCCHGDLCNKGPKYIPESDTWIGQNLHSLLIG